MYIFSVSHALNFTRFLLSGYELDNDGSGATATSKVFINEYTLTMDIKLTEAPPRDGLALFQTALTHVRDKKIKSYGKSALLSSDGECVVNQAGGVGQLGTFGDTSSVKVVPGRWVRIVVAVWCADDSDKNNSKGEMRTWIDTKSAALIKDEAIAKS